MSVNALNASAAYDARGCIRGNTYVTSGPGTGNSNCPFVPVTKNDVRYILNGRTAQTIFGTPFGNVARNSLRDAISNRLDATLFKNIKINENKNFELRVSATNALNHFNFGSINANAEWAGLTTSDIRTFGLPFADASTTAANGRVVTVSGKFSF